jgi:thiamine pyrophosphate-dependent acetolactate synthase large subunit-like protein
MSAPATLKVFQAVAVALFENGVDTMFGLMGDANMFMTDHYIRGCQGDYVSAANEAGAICMAIGYAQVTGKPGVCSVTYGPAVTNTITGLIEAAKGSVPIILVTGSTSLAARQHLQYAPQSDLAAAAGAGHEFIRSARTVGEDVARAVRRAQVERRPVLLEVPADLEWQDAEEFKVERVRIPENRALTSESRDLDDAVGIIAAAKRPVIVAGRGATSPESRAAILRLAQRIQAPVATTLKGKDLFRGEPFNLGIFGTLSTETATGVIMESDCMIAFGASLTTYTLSRGAFRKNKRLVQINLEPEEVGKNGAPDAGIVGHPAEVANLIVHWLDEAEIPPSGGYTDELQARLDAEGLAERPFDLGDGKVDYFEALRRLDESLPENRVIVCDSGRFALGVWKHVSAPDPRSFVHTSNFASIGLGLSAGIGAAAAGLGRPVVVMIGDGGFMNGGLAEFNSAVRAKSDLIVVVFNDGCYGAEQVKFARREMDDSSVLFDWPDLASVAVALGGQAVTLRCAADWSGVLQAIEGRTKPLLIDIKLDHRKIPWEA